ncbi:redoxin domain-containing protein [Kiloniella laminariae]|uniref:Redoxin domain-containing protein n=1 Tax=Kiloniella laminariae TaxID=454162 RepID=A0ABT4LF03_9PROT|nr:redoxin domain-containing protein [Kiloniella laminariae]MCZ4279667.1 redoxin domain-containing protein [Kiloniella laminariae]
MRKLQKAPALQVAQWFNSKEDITLESLRGRVVLIEVFQMLCPGCVELGLPQAKRAAQLFSPDDLVVLGLHSVFEHHAAMSPVSLKAFLHEYRISFPVAVDQPALKGTIPQTMELYQLQGTPSLILIDRQGYLRRVKFGSIDDMQLGAEIMSLIREDCAVEEDGTARTDAASISPQDRGDRESRENKDEQSGCGDSSCAI